MNYTKPIPTAPSEVSVATITEHPEITWARKTLEAFPGTHFYMPKIYGRPMSEGAIECSPCALGWLAFAVVGKPHDTEAREIGGRLNPLIGGSRNHECLFNWRYLLPEFAAHPREAVPKAVFIEAFNRVARGERITAL